MMLDAPSEIAKEIRRRIIDLNDILLLAALKDVDVEFDVKHNRDDGEPTQLRVYISQEV